MCRPSDRGRPRPGPWPCGRAACSWPSARCWSGATLGFARTGAIDLLATLLVLGAALLMQVITNMQNDVGYTVRGGDSSGTRTGLPRATANGWLSVRHVRAGIVVAALVAVAFGLALVAYRGWPVLAIGVASLLAALAYMGGPRPIAYTPYGELTVFVFFGLVAVNGTDWVLTGSVGTVSLLASVAIGSLAAAALAVNNHRDIAHDRLVGRRTFAVSFGTQASLGLFSLLLLRPSPCCRAWRCGPTRRPCCCRCCCCRRPGNCAATSSPARPARPSTNCCSAPSGWSCGSLRCCRPAPCSAGCSADARDPACADASCWRLRWLAAPRRRPRPPRASGFPRRPVRIVVPYSVGIGPDVVARSVAEVLAQQWGQTVWVDNKPGASGIVAFGEVRRTPPDGHTLFLADTATLAVNPLLHATLPYDPVRDLVPLSLMFRATFLIWVGGRSRFQSVGELLAAARRAPDSVSYGTLGNGHASHVAIESFARAADVRMLHVPFKDAGTLFAAVAAGDVDFTAFGMNSVAGLMAAGRLRPLAVAASRRLPGHPDIPTLREAGGPPVDMHPWAALVAVAGTPRGHAGAAAARHRRRAGPLRGAEARRAGRLRDHAVHAAGAARAHRRRQRAVRAAGQRRPRGAAVARQTRVGLRADGSPGG